jgi:hypothetical protein
MAGLEPAIHVLKMVSPSSSLSRSVRHGQDATVTGEMKDVAGRTSPATTRSAVMVATMVVIAAVIARRRELHRFEFNRGHPCGDV